MLEAEVEAVKKAQAEQTDARRDRDRLMGRIEAADQRILAADNAVTAATKALLEAAGLRYAQRAAGAIVESGTR